MKHKALALVLLAAVTAGTALAFNYGDQERREGQEREREVRREQSERPRVHPLAVALELQKKLELNEEQIAQLLERWKVYGPAREKHVELIAKLREQYEESDGKKRQELGNRIESTIKEFNTWSEKLTRETFEIVGPDRTEVIRQTMREISGRRERERGGERERAVDRERGIRREREFGREREVRQERDVRRERPQAHPLGMALELQERLGLSEEQVKRFQDMWGEYREVQQHNRNRLEELEREMAAIRREYGQFEERVLGDLYESLGPDQRDMLRNHMREINQRPDRPTDRAPQTDRRRETDRREDGQDREFEQMVAELRKLVAAGEITGNQAEERIAATRKRMGGGRKPENPIGHHPMAYALEGARRIRLTEKQVKTLQDAWNELYPEAAKYGEMLRKRESDIARLRENGEWIDRTAAEYRAWEEELEGAIQGLHWRADEILADTLNKEQRNGVEELMAAAKNRDGGRRSTVNPMNGHALAWALELHEKLGLNEKQTATLKEAHASLRREGDGLNERQMGLDRRMAELREAGRMTDGAEREFEAAMKNIGADREAIQAKASEILVDTLNGEQLAQLRRIIADRRENDG